MKMEKRKFRIGELAKVLNVERFVIRFWEKEFMLKATRSGGGQRFYDEKDLEKFKLIKDLLYERGFTISGARKQLKGKPNSVIPSQKTTMEHDSEIMISEEDDALHGTVREKLLAIRKQLIYLRKFL